MENKNEKPTQPVKEEKKPGEKPEIKKDEIKKEEEKKEKKQKEEKKGKKKEKEKPKKEEAVVNAKDLPLSTKYSVAICNMIRKKKPQEAIDMLEKVLRKKLAVPCKGEIPHRKKGHRTCKILSGKYPVKASNIFIKLLKNLIANANVNDLDTENIIITKAVANIAARPVKPTRLAFGRKKFKRTHVVLVAKEIKNKEQEEKKVEKKEEKKEEKKPEIKTGKTGEKKK